MKNLFLNVNIKAKLSIHKQQAPMFKSTCLFLLYFCLFITFKNQFAQEAGIIYPFFEEYFKYDSLLLEKACYEVLKSKTEFFKTAQYLAVPWRGLYWECFKQNRKKYHSKIDELARLKMNNGFTVVMSLHHLDGYALDLLEKIGIKYIFTPSATLSKTKYKSIDIIAMPHYALNGSKPAPIKDILYSFVGTTDTHPIRKKIFAMKHPANTVLIQRPQWLFSKGSEEYKNILSRSRFSLCPRGFNAGSIRFWESLQAGAIPVIISDDGLLPDGFNWSQCVINIKEKDIDAIPSVIANIPVEQESLMRIACLEAYQMFSGNNLASPVELLFNERVF